MEKGSFYQDSYLSPRISCRLYFNPSHFRRSTQPTFSNFSEKKPSPQAGSQANPLFRPRCLAEKATIKVSHYLWRPELTINLLLSVEVLGNLPGKLFWPQFLHFSIKKLTISFC